jgi:hypothetical protein
MVEATQVERSDARTIVVSGIKLGVVTAVSVVVYALTSRAMSGSAATIVQTLMLLTGGAIFAYGPSHFVKPRSVDSIAWAAMVGLMGALAFTVIDTAALRPLHIYSWKWDAIGGGSGMWYIPVWWMGSAFVAWLGGWVTATAARSNPNPGLGATALPTVGIAIVVFAVLAATGVAPFHQGTAALSFALGLVIHALTTAFFNRR